MTRSGPPRASIRWLVAGSAALALVAVIGIASFGTGPIVALATSSPSGLATAANATQDELSARPGTSKPATATPTPMAQSSASTTPALGIVAGSVNATSINLTAEYQATVHLSFATRSFQVASTMTVTNSSGIAIDRLELNTIVARLGHMTLTLARVDGVPVSPTVTDQTIHLPLGGILPPGATTTVRIGYRATLRSDLGGSNWLFTRTNGILEAHRWLPWISIPTPFDRPNHGDPFVTAVSPRVRVTIVSDRAMPWATTGEQTSPTGTVTTFEARNVRDFAIVGAPDFQTRTATVGTVVIRVRGRPGFPAAAVLSAARTALSREAALLGPYPYRTYELAQTAGGYGMEAPGLTWIPSGAGNLAYLVAHETGHQWFYGIVGNDQARQPYADEAATDFVARYVLGLRRSSQCSTARLDLSIYAYSRACYYEDIYIQGGNFLDDTRRQMGSAAFWAGIHEYLATYRFKLATTRALLTTLDAHTPLDLRARFHARFPSLF